MVHSDPKRLEQIQTFGRIAVAGKHSDFRDALLIALAKHAEGSTSQYMDAKKAADAEGLSYIPGWVSRAVEHFENRGLVKALRTMGGGIDGAINVRLTSDGFDEAEELTEKLSTIVENEVSVAPASDRVVRIDHNSQAYRDTDNAIHEALEIAKENNQLAAEEPEEHEQAIAELEGGRRLLKAVRVRAEAAWAIIAPPLKWLAAKFVDTAIGKAFEAALLLIGALLGISLG
jgi:hypothetical protein